VQLAVGGWAVRSASQRVILIALSGRHWVPVQVRQYACRLGGACNACSLYVRDLDAWEV